MVDVIIEPALKVEEIEKMKITDAYSVKNNNPKNEEFKDISITLRPNDSLYTIILDTVKNSQHIYLDLSSIGYDNIEGAIISYSDDYITDHTITLMLRSVL